MFVCLSVLYLLGHGTSKCNQTFQRIRFRPGEGHRVVFDPKFSPRGVFAPSHCWFTTVSAFSRESMRVIVLEFVTERRTYHRVPLCIVYDCYSMAYLPVLYQACGFFCFFFGCV